MTETPVPHDISRLSYDHLGAFDSAITRAALRSRVILYSVVAILAVLAWTWLVFMAVGVSVSNPFAGLGPGMQGTEGWFASITPDWLVNSSFLYWLGSICAPNYAENTTGLPLLLAFSMWFAMAIAMMLPSAAPMLRTYADIAETAAQKGEIVAPLWVLASGYLAIWAAFAASTALLQGILVNQSLIVGTGLPALGILSGLILIGAGLFQFTSLKHACLEKCRNPFTTLFGSWTNERAGIFKLGLQQGLFCLGCCWALMMVMFSVGLMNLVWMAMLTFATIFEKSVGGKATSRLFGLILLAWGAIILLVSLKPMAA